MNSTEEYINSNDLNALRLMLGRKVLWMYGTPFLIESNLTVATRMAMFVGRSSLVEGTDSFLSFGSERLETSDGLDYARFRIHIADSLGAALGTTGALFVDTSVIVDISQSTIQNIRILEAFVDGEEDQVHYDAAIRFEFDDTRSLTIGHAPGVYEGVCMTPFETVTLGNPGSFRQRVLLAR